MTETKGKKVSGWMLIAGIYFIISAISTSAFIVLYDARNIVLYILTLLSLISGVAVFLKKRIGLYSTTIGIPLIIIISATTLSFTINTYGFNPNMPAFLLNLLLIVYCILWLIIGLIIIDNREALH
ncbi:hypothetical protein [[Eubacterium] cellulosolvens]